MWCCWYSFTYRSHSCFVLSLWPFPPQFPIRALSLLLSIRCLFPPGSAFYSLLFTHSFNSHLCANEPYCACVLSPGCSWMPASDSVSPNLSSFSSLQTLNSFSVLQSRSLPFSPLVIQSGALGVTLTFPSHTIPSSLPPSPGSPQRSANSTSLIAPDTFSPPFPLPLP